MNNMLQASSTNYTVISVQSKTPWMMYKKIAKNLSRLTVALYEMYHVVLVLGGLFFVSIGILFRLQVPFFLTGEFISTYTVLSVFCNCVWSSIYMWASIGQVKENILRDDKKTTVLLDARGQWKSSGDVTYDNALNNMKMACIAALCQIPLWFLLMASLYLAFQLVLFHEVSFFVSIIISTMVIAFFTNDLIRVRFIRSAKKIKKHTKNIDEFWFYSGVFFDVNSKRNL